MVSRGVQQAGVPDHAVLDDLGAAVGKVGLGEGVQGVQVAEDGPGLVEGPRQVLAVYQVDGGLAPTEASTAANRVVGTWRRRPPEVGSGGKAGEVPHHAAPPRAMSPSARVRWAWARNSSRFR